MDTCIDIILHSNLSMNQFTMNQPIIIGLGDADDHENKDPITHLCGFAMCVFHVFPVKFKCVL